MITRHHSGSRLSLAVTYPLSGKAVQLAGLCADEGISDVTEQTANVLAKIDTLLAECGASKSDVVAAWIWLSDMAYYDEMNVVWDGWIAAGQAPVRACVESTLARDFHKVEIQVQAVIAG